MKKIFSLFLISILQAHCLSGQSSAYKIEGVSLESPPFELTAEDFQSLSGTYANWVAVIPYGFSPADNPRVHFDSERQWWGERLEGAAEMIEIARKQGFKIMLKPQVWIFRGWVGDYGFETEKEWKEWEESYEEFILTFARLADSLNVDLFCLGTEYRRATHERPQFWIELVDRIREVYRGKLTYAANWDEYENIPFWQKLDFIGVDAYFPLSQEKTPDIGELLLNWLPAKVGMKALAGSLDMPILLTEFGYRSVDGAAGKQWDLNSQDFNEEAQRRAYLAVFESLWGEDWIAGGFFWKWRFGKMNNGEKDRSYTPQGKPAMKVIQSVYRK